ncbi:acetyl-CoA hydrolase [Bdellovibrio sp. qaytius]|nr:acetyl-CoA hydrolase [Bdellovibrio sp. qaytius]
MSGEKLKTKILSTISEGADFIFAELGNDLRLAAPLGLGKPNQLLNEIYQRAANDPKKSLKIFTALSLGLPQTNEELGKRFLKPFADRHLGNDYPVLQYYQAAVSNKLPSNIQVHEFYFQAGTAQKSEHLQRNYQSVNYTHVCENILLSDVNVIVQLVAVKKENGKNRYSLSCNPDLTTDVVELYKETTKKLIVVAVIHPDLPFLAGDAEVSEDFFAAVIQSDEVKHQLFALPRTPISKEDHLIGFYASQFVRDGGTLQIGIGSLSDAIVSALKTRHQDNSRYQRMAQDLEPVVGAHTDIFKQGLYGLTEMLTDGFMHLREYGILNRQVTDDKNQKTYLHGAFILGSKALYQWLRHLPAQDAQGLRMTRVSKVNDLYDPQELLLRKQRIHPRFFNTTMQVTLLGEAMSETLSDGVVVSGVGGQFNFITMSRELKDSISILMLRSKRLDKDGKSISNIVWNPGHVTVPRHLRDVVITEYGAAFLKGKTDEQCIKALLAITDSQFQEGLIKTAKAAGKLAQDYILPSEFKNNTSASLAKTLATNDFSETFTPFPFGSDFTSEEEKIALALEKIQQDKKISLWKILCKAFFTKASSQGFEKELQRLNLDKPKSIKHLFYRRLVLAYL